MTAAQDTQPPPDPAADRTITWDCHAHVIGKQRCGIGSPRPSVMLPRRVTLASLGALDRLRISKHGRRDWSWDSTRSRECPIAGRKADLLPP